MRALFLIMFFGELISLLISCNFQGTTKYSCADLKNNYTSIFSHYKGKKELNILKTHLNKTIVAAPKCETALIMIGDIDVELENTKEALFYYKQAEKLDTSNVYTLVMCGVTNEFLKNYDSAVFYYDLAVREKTKNPYIIDETDQFKKLKNTKSYDVEFLKIILRRGIANYFKRDLKKSLNDLNYCVKNEYMLGEAYLYKGFCLMDIGQREEGCKDLRAAESYGNKIASEYISKSCDK